MLPVPFSESESERLRSLQALDILDTPPEDRFDRITRLAARLFNVPIALIGLTDRDRHWYKSRVGVPLQQIPRNDSFCDHSIAQGDIYVVNDAIEDPLFVNNPHVTGDLNLRFYAGIPLRAENRQLVGVLCVIDHQPRTFSREDLVAMRDLAAMAEHELGLAAQSRAVAKHSGSERWFRSMVDHLPDGVFMLDAHGSIESFNPAAERIFGIEFAAIAGSDASVLMADKLPQFDHLASHHRNGELHEGVGKRANGEVFPMELAVSQMYVGGRQKFAVMVRDISKRKSEAAELAGGAESKRKYYAQAAHEMRAPLASVVGFADMLVERKLNDETLREIAGIISGESKRLVKLINEMLDLASLERSGGLDLDLQTQAIGPLIERTVQAMGGMPDSSRLVLDIAASLPAVPLDAQKIQQALIDIVSNAIKYSPQGGPIMIRAASTRKGNADIVSISIKDSGIGMTPGQKARVFEPFYRARQLKSAEGTGLGMSIVKEIIELHNGTVEIESAFDSGTEVIINLPVDEQFTFTRAPSTPSS
ncbi:MAG: ATP-binding protein [Janthinobacterium lividum]